MRIRMRKEKKNNKKNKSNLQQKTVKHHTLEIQTKEPIKT